MSTPYQPPGTGGYRQDPYSSETVLAQPQQPPAGPTYQPAGPTYTEPPGYCQPLAYGQAPYGPAPGAGYGWPVRYGPPAVAQESNPLALAAFVCGLVGIVLTGVFSPLLIAGIVGGVLGLVALNGFKQEPGRYNNKWMAVVGIVCGALCVLGLVLLIVLAVAFSSLPSQP